MRDWINSLRKIVRNNTANLKVGLWGLLNSLLVPAYGIFAILVIYRIMPKYELGAYMVMQMLYLLIVQMARSFGYTPMVRHFFERHRRSDVIGAGIILTCSFQLVAFVILILVRSAMARVLSCDSFPHLVGIIALSALAGVIMELRISILQALQRTRQIFVINLGYQLVFILWVASFAYRGQLESAAQLLHGMLLATGIGSIVALLISPRGLFTPRFSAAELKRLFHFGKYTLGSGMSSALFTRIDVLVLSAFQGPVGVAPYGIAKTFIRVFDIYTHTANLVVFPFFSRLWSERRLSDMIRFYRGAMIASNAAIAPLVVGLILAAEPMVRIFYQAKYPSAGALLAVLSLVGLTVPWRILSHNVINAAGIPRFVFASRMLIAGLNLVLDILLVWRFGAMGAVVATVISLAILSVVLTQKTREVMAGGALGKLGVSPEIVEETPYVSR